MELSPYEKLCQQLLGGLPENNRFETTGRTTSDLADLLGLDRNTIYRWPMLPGTSIRVIPAGRGNLVELLTGGRVTADEVRAFARRYKSGQAA